MGLNIIQKILNKVEEEAQQETKVMAKGVFRASEIGGCPRAIQYSRLGYTPEPFTPETLLLFKDGNVHHNAVRELLAKTGTLSMVEFTVSKHYKHKGVNLVISGTLDGVWNGRPFDIKSMSTFMFKTLDKDWPGKYLNYLDQLTIYLDILQKPEGFFIFKDKNSSELRVKTVFANTVLMQGILNRLVEIKKGIKEKKLIERPYARDHWKCKYCNFRLECWKLPMEGRKWAAYAPREREGAKDDSGSNIGGQLRESLKQARERKP